MFNFKDQKTTQPGLNEKKREGGRYLWNGIKHFTHPGWGESQASAGPGTGSHELSPLQRPLSAHLPLPSLSATGFLISHVLADPVLALPDVLLSRVSGPGSLDPSSKCLWDRFGPP